jgi:hypothetical protein
LIVPGLSLAFGNLAEGDASVLSFSKSYTAQLSQAPIIAGVDGWGRDLSSGGIFVESYPYFSFQAPLFNHPITVKLHPDGWEISKPDGYRPNIAYYDNNGTKIALESSTHTTDLFKGFLERLYSSYSSKFGDFPPSATWVKPVQNLFGANPQDVVIPRSLPVQSYLGEGSILVPPQFATSGVIHTPRLQLTATPSAQSLLACGSGVLLPSGFEYSTVINPPLFGGNARQTSGAQVLTDTMIFNPHAALETWMGTTIFSDSFKQALVFDAISTIRNEEFNTTFTSIEDINLFNVTPIKNFAPSGNQVTMILDHRESENRYNYLMTDSNYVYVIESLHKELLEIFDPIDLTKNDAVPITNIDAIYGGVATNNFFIAQGTNVWLVEPPINDPFDGFYSIVSGPKELPYSATDIGINKFPFFWDYHQVQFGDYENELKWHSFIQNGNQWLLWGLSGVTLDITDDLEEIFTIDLSNIGSDLIGGVAGRAMTLSDHGLFISQSSGVVAAKQNTMWAWTQENIIENPMEMSVERRASMDNDNVYFAGQFLTKNRVSLEPLDLSFVPPDSIDITAFSQTFDYVHVSRCEQPNLMRAAVDINKTSRAVEFSETEPVGEAVVWDNKKFAFNVIDISKDYTQQQDLLGFHAPKYIDIFGEFTSTISQVIDNGDGTLSLIDNKMIFGKNGCQNSRDFIKDNWRPEPLPTCSKISIRDISDSTQELGELSILDAFPSVDGNSGTIKIIKPSFEISAGSTYRLVDYNPVMIPLGMWYAGNTLGVLTNFGNLTKNLFVIEIDVSDALDLSGLGLFGHKEIVIPSNHLGALRSHIVKDFCVFEDEYHFKIFTIFNNELVSSGNTIRGYYKVPRSGPDIQTAQLLTSSANVLSAVGMATMPTRIFNNEKVYITSNPGPIEDVYSDFTFFDVRQNNSTCILDASFNRHRLSNYFQPPVGNPYQFISEMTFTNQLFRPVASIPLPSGMGVPQFCAQLRNKRFNEVLYELADASGVYRCGLGKLDSFNDTYTGNVISRTNYAGAYFGGGISDLVAVDTRWGGSLVDKTFSVNMQTAGINKTTIQNEFEFRSALENGAWAPEPTIWDLGTFSWATLTDLKSVTLGLGNGSNRAAISSSGILQPETSPVVTTGFVPGFLRGEKDKRIIFENNGDIKGVLKCTTEIYANSGDSLVDFNITTPASGANHYDGRHYWSYNGTEIKTRDLFNQKVDNIVNEMILRPSQSLGSGVGLVTYYNGGSTKSIIPHLWSREKQYIGGSFIDAVLPISNTTGNENVGGILDFNPDGDKMVARINLRGESRGTFNADPRLSIVQIEINDTEIFGAPIYVYDMDNIGILNISSGTTSYKTTPIDFGRYGSFDERYEFFDTTTPNSIMYRWELGSITAIISENASQVAGSACAPSLGSPKPNAYFVRDGFFCIQWFERGTIIPTCCLERFSIVDSTDGSLIETYGQIEGSGFNTYGVPGNPEVGTGGTKTCCKNDYAVLYKSTASGCFKDVGTCAFQEQLDVADIIPLQTSSASMVRGYSTMHSPPIITINDSHMLSMNRVEASGACGGDPTKPTVAVTGYYLVEDTEIAIKPFLDPSGFPIKWTNAGFPFIGEANYNSGALRFRQEFATSTDKDTGDGTHYADTYKKIPFGSGIMSEVSYWLKNINSGRYVLNSERSIRKLRPNFLIDIG